MAKKKTVKSIRVDSMLDERIRSYAQASGLRESEALRKLIEQGLACESLNVFATPVGALMREVIEAEFNLLRAELEESAEQLEERIAKVTSKGTKHALATNALLLDVSRAIVPAWKATNPLDLWKYYA